MFYTNEQILVRLQEKRQLTRFARFIGISQQGLRKRLESQKLKDNLSGVYIQFLLSI